MLAGVLFFSFLAPYLSTSIHSVPSSRRRCLTGLINRFLFNRPTFDGENALLSELEDSQLNFLPIDRSVPFRRRNVILAGLPRRDLEAGLMHRFDRKIHHRYDVARCGKWLVEEKFSYFDNSTLKYSRYGVTRWPDADSETFLLLETSLSFPLRPDAEPEVGRFLRCVSRHGNYEDEVAESLCLFPTTTSPLKWTNFRIFARYSSQKRFLNDTGQNGLVFYQQNVPRIAGQNPNCLSANSLAHVRGMVEFVGGWNYRIPSQTEKELARLQIRNDSGPFPSPTVRCSLSLDAALSEIEDLEQHFCDREDLAILRQKMELGRIDSFFVYDCFRIMNGAKSLAYFRLLITLDRRGTGSYSVGSIGRIMVTRDLLMWTPPDDSLCDFDSIVARTCSKDQAKLMLGDDELKKYFKYKIVEQLETFNE